MADEEGIRGVTYDNMYFGHNWCWNMLEHSVRFKAFYGQTAIKMLGNDWVSICHFTRHWVSRWTVSFSENSIFWLKLDLLKVFFLLIDHHLSSCKFIIFGWPNRNVGDFLYICSIFPISTGDFLRVFPYVPTYSRDCCNIFTWFSPKSLNGFLTHTHMLFSTDFRNLPLDFPHVPLNFPTFSNMFTPLPGWCSFGPSTGGVDEESRGGRDGPPKSSIYRWMFHEINHPAIWGSPIYENPYIYIYITYIGLTTYPLYTNQH